MFGSPCLEREGARDGKEGEEGGRERGRDWPGTPLFLPDRLGRWSTASLEREQKLSVLLQNSRIMRPLSALRLPQTLCILMPVVKEIQRPRTTGYRACTCHGRWIPVTTTAKMKRVCGSRGHRACPTVPARLACCTPAESLRIQSGFAIGIALP